jgi:hypothetical protein
MNPIAVAYIVFNRPVHTSKSFEAIRLQRPEKLFIIADGPRIGHPTDQQKCEEVRSLLIDVDWPCEVYRNYSDVNLGCKRRVSSGLDWVFSHTERAIVLEDDCVPHSDFFPFCDALLERYADDHRVAVITGNNHQDGRKSGDAAYYFSKHCHCWGWATWRRAWANYDGELSFWPQWRDSTEWGQFVSDRVERNYWRMMFDRVRNGNIDSWAFPWTASVWYHGGLTATPNVNLVTNIGFGPEATHTLAQSDQEGTPSRPLGQLTHPKAIERDKKADHYVFLHLFDGRNQSFLNRVRWFPRRVANKIGRVMSKYNDKK